LPTKEGRKLFARSRGQFKRFRGRTLLASTDLKAPKFKILSTTQSLLMQFPKKKRTIMGAQRKLFKATTLKKQNIILADLLPKLRK